MYIFWHDKELREVKHLHGYLDSQLVKWELFLSDFSYVGLYALHISAMGKKEEKRKCTQHYSVRM